MGISAGPDMIQNGLVLALDAADRNSYISGSTTWTDISGNNNNGTLINGPTFSSANQGSIVFDGTNDYCNLPTSAVPAGNEITITCWSKVNTQKESSIVSAQNSLGGREISIHLPWADSIIYWDCGSGGGTYDRLTSSPLTIQQRTGWHNWALIKNATTGIMSIYIDGTVLTSGTGRTKPIVPVSTCLIASLTNSAAYYYSGDISSMLFYNRALSSQEVLQNYNATKTRFGL